MTATADQSTTDASPKGFRRHRFLDYQGYSFPWYATLIWIGYFVGGLAYFVKNVLLQ